MNEDIVTAIVAAAAALLGALTKGGWEWLRARSSGAATVTTAQIGDGAQIRAELWAELENLRKRIDAMQAELDRSRREYLGLLEEHTALKGEYRALKHEHDELQIRYAALERRIDNV